MWERVILQLPRNHHALNLARPFINLGNPRIAVVALHRIVFKVAIATVDLDGFGTHILGHFRSKQFGLRSF